ncbi:helix-turn-helix domain-containing protein [Salinarimonas ramus]|uniref:AraC family transcriptional regulator n=1 Tax=Salinarimonas ramus TaxID=690164 RepID=A0A917Q4W1_9HYPH|nr:helix-turn-helix domain-containing protein [Salinarimonas ramus]GGK22456.1 AraC family transcriptional regulator [Salinarimonas ramus]
MAAGEPVIIGEWEAAPQADGVATILPDGCIDLVLVARPGAPLAAHASALMAGPTPVAIRAGERLHGLRLAPGWRIDTAALAAILARADDDPAAIRARLPDWAIAPGRLEDALACLREARDVSAAAACAGVRLRTLQRLVLAETGRTPDFWRRLARARRAGRALAEGQTPTNAAYGNDFADQPHLTRELVRFFGTTPARLARDERLAEQVRATGYG